MSRAEAELSNKGPISAIEPAPEVHRLERAALTVIVLLDLVERQHGIFFRAKLALLVVIFDRDAVHVVDDLGQTPAFGWEETRRRLLRPPLPDLVLEPLPDTWVGVLC